MLHIKMTPFFGTLGTLCLEPDIDTCTIPPNCIMCQCQLCLTFRRVSELEQTYHRNNCVYRQQNYNMIFCCIKMIHVPQINIFKNLWINGRIWTKLTLRVSAFKIVSIFHMAAVTINRSRVKHTYRSHQATFFHQELNLTRSMTCMYVIVFAETMCFD